LRYIRRKGVRAGTSGFFLSGAGIEAASKLFSFATLPLRIPVDISSH
jgi:hypothetical protein